MLIVAIPFHIEMPGTAVMPFHIEMPGTAVMPFHIEMPGTAVMPFHTWLAQDVKENIRSFPWEKPGSEGRAMPNVAVPWFHRTATFARWRPSCAVVPCPPPLLASFEQ